MDEHVGTNLRALREARGMTQANLAEALEVDERTVQRIEAGDVRPQKSTLRKITEVLNVELSNLRRESSSSLECDAPTETTPTTRLPEPPAYDPATEQLVQLVPVRRAMYLCDALRRIEMTRFVRRDDLTDVQAAMVEQLFGFLHNLTIGFGISPEDAQREAQLELQADLDELATTGVVLAYAMAEIVVLPPVGLPGIKPHNNATLVVGVSIPGRPPPAVVLPLVSEWSGEAVKP